MIFKETYYTARTAEHPSKTGFNKIVWIATCAAPPDYENTVDSSVENATAPLSWGWEEYTRAYVSDAVVPELSDAQLLAAFNRLKELGLIK